MRIEDPKKKEATFKASQKIQRNKKKHSSPSPSLDEELDEEMDNFINKMKRGTSKYKWKIPLKGSHYGKTGHLVAKYPLRDDGESNPKQKSNNGKYSRKKILISKERDDSYEDDEED